MTRKELLERLNIIRDYLHKSDFETGRDEYYIELNGVLLKIDDLVIENCAPCKCVGGVYD